MYTIRSMHMFIYFLNKIYVVHPEVYNINLMYKILSVYKVALYFFNACMYFNGRLYSPDAVRWIRCSRPTVSMVDIIPT